MDSIACLRKNIDKKDLKLFFEDQQIIAIEFTEASIINQKGDIKVNFDF